MASKFFHVYHEFRAGKAQQWWETVQAAMAPGGGWVELVAKNLESGFYNHFFARLAQKALFSVSGKFAKELRLKNFRTLLMVRMV